MAKEKTAKQLIEERAKHNAKKGMFEGTKVRSYNCLDTGKHFKTMGEAVRSPFTGTKNIHEVDDLPYQQLTDIPAGLKDPFTQDKPEDDPTDDKELDWNNRPWYGNDIPAAGDYGVTKANGDGYVTYSPTAAPGYVIKAPGQQDGS